MDHKPPTLGDFTPIQRSDGEQAQRIAALEAQVRALQTQPEPAQTPKKQKVGFDAWSLRIALGATIGLTASGEFQLAVLAGWGVGLAWLLPVSIDVYVVQAFRRHRDVAPALMLMVLANAVYHLAAKGLFGVVVRDGQPVLNAADQPQPTWQLVVGVAAIAPVVMWRIHRMTAPKRERTPRAAAPPAAPADALTKPPAERAQAPADERSQTGDSERPPARTERAHDERPQKPNSERPERAHTAPKKSAKKGATKSDTERRNERTRDLYTELGKRPEWTDIRDAWVTAKLAKPNVSRSTCQRSRDAVETKEPQLATLGADNVRTLNRQTHTG